MADIREIKNKFFTSVEQGRQIVKSGIDPNTSDLHWNVYGHNGGKIFDNEYRLCFNSGCWEEDENGYVDVPCWSLSALLRLFPSVFTNDEGVDVQAKPYVSAASEGEDAICAFGDMSRSGADSVDAVFNMLMVILKK